MTIEEARRIAGNVALALRIQGDLAEILAKESNDKTQRVRHSQFHESAEAIELLIAQSNHLSPAEPAGAQS